MPKLALTPNESHGYAGDDTNADLTPLVNPYATLAVGTSPGASAGRRVASSQ
jgi:hypothetical protein